VVRIQPANVTPDVDEQYQAMAAMIVAEEEEIADANAKGATKPELAMVAGPFSGLVTLTFSYTSRQPIRLGGTPEGLLDNPLPWLRRVGHEDDEVEDELLLMRLQHLPTKEVLGLEAYIRAAHSQLKAMGMSSSRLVLPDEPMANSLANLVLLEATRHCNLPVVQAALASGADANKCSINPAKFFQVEKALVLAGMFPRPSIFRALLEAGADPNMVDCLGWRPLHCLALAIEGAVLDGVALCTPEGALKCVKLALEYGVSISLRCFTFTFFITHN